MNSFMPLRFRCVLLFCLFVLATSLGHAQRKGLRVMEYNVENLFDTLHAANALDIDFTPKGSHQWTSARYWAKLSRLSKVIAAVGGVQPVDLIALVEVENDSVMFDLTRRTKLWRMGYEYVMSHSQDVRGINVALLYLPHRFRLLMKDSIRVQPPTSKQLPTRDVLHVAGELVTGDTLDVFVCHFPSRRGGRLAERYRENVAQLVRAFADSVMLLRQHPYVLITGDFNGFYPEKFITQHLNLQLLDGANKVASSSLYLLTHKLKAKWGIKGTYKFQGMWNQLDHFVVSGTFLGKKGTSVSTDSKSCYIFDAPFLLQKDKSGEGFHPYRTYLGNYYQGGYSDHLPMVLDISF